MFSKGNKETDVTCILEAGNTVTEHTESWLVGKQHMQQGHLHLEGVKVHLWPFIIKSERGFLFLFNNKVAWTHVCPSMTEFWILYLHFIYQSRKDKKCRWALSWSKSINCLRALHEWKIVCAAGPFYDWYLMFCFTHFSISKGQTHFQKWMMWQCPLERYQYSVP